MKYRHSYHAGNFADVHKHVALVALLDALMRKDAGLLYLDTHAGRGSYPLEAGRDTSQAEWRDGVGKLLGTTPRAAELTRWLALAGAEAGTYPASRRRAAMLQRQVDRAALADHLRHEGEVRRPDAHQDTPTGVLRRPSAATTSGPMRSIGSTKW